MAPNLIANIREEINKIKELRKKATQKITVESLKNYKGFENLSTETRQQFLDTMRELCRIALSHITNTNNKK